MGETSYQFRLSMAQSEATYRIAEQDLVWSRGGENGRLPFSDIAQIRIYGSPGVGSAAPSFQRCVVTPKSGRPHVFSSNHYVSLGKFEDRSASFQPFVETLMRRVAAANPATVFISGMPAALWTAWAAIVIGVVIVTPLALLVIIINLVRGAGFSGVLATTTVFLLGLLFGLVPLARMLLRNRPRRFDPRAARSA